MATRKKTPEQIVKANLGKVLSRLKTKVAEKEEVWLETFMDLIPLCIKEEEVLTKEAIDLASEMTDYFLDTWETRWGRSE